MTASRRTSPLDQPEGTTEQPEDLAIDRARIDEIVHDLIHQRDYGGDEREP